VSQTTLQNPRGLSFGPLGRGQPLQPKAGGPAPFVVGGEDPNPLTPFPMKEGGTENVFVVSLLLKKFFSRSPSFEEFFFGFPFLVEGRGLGVRFRRARCSQTTARLQHHGDAMKTVREYSGGARSSALPRVRDERRLLLPTTSKCTPFGGSSGGSRKLITGYYASFVSSHNPILLSAANKFLGPWERCGTALRATRGLLRTSICQQG